MKASRLEHLTVLLALSTGSACFNGRPVCLSDGDCGPVERCTAWGACGGNWWAECWSSDDCVDGLDCVIDDFGRGICSIYFCGSNDDCECPETGECDAACMLGQLSTGAVCLLRCGGALACPDDMACLDSTWESNAADGVCLWPREQR